MSSINKQTTREELAAMVVKTLEFKNIPAVLVGGSVVSIYTNNEYASKDLDFISPADHKEIVTAMSEIGFTPKGKDFYHPTCQFTVEFPGRVLTIGDMEPITAEGELKVNDVTIKLYSPTQCIMDRLAWFYFNNDRQGLDQAVMVYKAQGASLDKIKQWSKSEGELEKYEIFLSYLSDETESREQ